MRPAFSSTRSAVAFGAALALTALLPAVMPLLAAITGGFNLRDRYPLPTVFSGEYCKPSFLENQIFSASNAVDIVFMGSSHIGDGIDPRAVQQ